MSAPGGGFGEEGRGDEANPPPTGGRDDWKPPWDPPAADYPPPAYPPPGYPPPIPPPPGYGQPPGSGGPPYPPGAPQFGGPPPGYGPPPYPGGYPGGYYPTPDYQVQAGTNRLAIASFIASFSGFICCVGSIVAIVLGVIALSQIKQTRQEGYGLAVAGIVIGVGSLLVSVIIAMFSIHLH